MYSDVNTLARLLLSLALVASSEAFFLKWGSDSTRQAASQKAWVQPTSPNMSPFRYQYNYAPYEPRKLYQVQQPQYSHPEPIQNMGPIPLSIPAGSSLTPVSLQHVQLVPCMCPVAPEEAEKLQEKVGPGPYLAQTYNPPYQPQQAQVDNNAKLNQ